MRLASALSLALAVLGLVEAHWELRAPKDQDEVEARKHEAREIADMATKCAPQIAKHEARRKARRDLAKRGIYDDYEIEQEAKHQLAKRGLYDVEDDAHLEARQVSSTQSALTPHYSAIQGSTCLTAPEVTEGPYYIKDEIIRSDLRETEKGVSLFLDIGVMDVSTCKPVDKAFVELWACNATGLYSSFTRTNFPQSVARTDKLNHLRGGYFTNPAGMVELATIYPGFYTSRTLHIHVLVHQNVQTRANGTMISTQNNLKHIGQIFFQEALNDEVIKHPLYRSNQIRTYNSGDTIFQQSRAGGYDSYAKIERLGATLDDGLLGYITIGINPNARQRIMSTEFFNPNWPSRPNKREEEDHDHEEDHHEHDEY